MLGKPGLLHYILSYLDGQDLREISAETDFEAIFLAMPYAARLPYMRWAAKGRRTAVLDVVRNSARAGRHFEHVRSGRYGDKQDFLYRLKRIEAAEQNGEG